MRSRVKYAIVRLALCGVLPVHWADTLVRVLRLAGA